MSLNVSAKRRPDGIQFSLGLPRTSSVNWRMLVHNFCGFIEGLIFVKLDYSNTQKQRKCNGVAVTPRDETELVVYRGGRIEVVVYFVF